MALDKKTLEEFKELLLKEQKKIEDEHKRIAKPVNEEAGDYATTYTNIGDDEDENASEVEEYAGNLAIESSLEKRLVETKEALKRIEDGTYGICENCGKEIPIERLKAYPSAKTCMQC